MIKSKKGSVIVMTVFIIFFGAMLFFTLEQLHRSDLEIVTNHIYDLQALYCADGGIERSLAHARFKSPWPPDTANNRNEGLVAINLPGPDGDEVDCTQDTTETSIGTYKLFIREERVDTNVPFGGANPPSDYYNLMIITSCAKVGNFRRAVEAKVRRTMDENGEGNDDFTMQVISWKETSDSRCDF